MAKALMVVAPQNFRDEELFHTKEELESAGVQVSVASKTSNLARGMLGGTIRPNMTLADVNVGEYNAVIFIGGSGASTYFNDSSAHNIAQQAADSNKVLAAICIAPSILANAGVLNGKRATCFPSEAQNLKANRVAYTGEDVTQDGRIITASGPEAAREFGRRIVNSL